MPAPYRCVGHSPYSPLKAVHPPRSDRPWSQWNPDDALGEDLDFDAYGEPVVIKQAKRRLVVLMVIGLAALVGLAAWEGSQPYNPEWAPAWHAAMEHMQGLR